MIRRVASVLLAGVLGIACTPAESQATPEPARPPTKNGPRETAVLAGGCFWGMEQWMRKAPGVVETDVGYAGGKSAKVSYEQVSDGNTGHAESVRIVFDPSVVSYDELLSKWFFRYHDPTTRNRQGNDAGPQYRSAIFPTTDAQRKTAELVKARVERSGKWGAPITTTIEPSPTFVMAEDYHQDYLVKHPDGYDNHYLRDYDFSAR
jgi:peptide methionine sulfoxide reductase msrA/msrB